MHILKYNVLMMLFCAQLCLLLDISYLYMYLYIISNIASLYVLCTLCCMILTTLCGILFIFIYIILYILNDRLINSIIILSLITCLFLICILRFTSISSNIILYIVYSLFISNVGLCIFQFGYIIEKVYFIYLTFFTLSYCILYGILGVLRIIWSLLIIVNLFLKIFLWVIMSHIYVDILFNSEYIILQGIISYILLAVNVDEFKHIYFIHNNFWIVICVLCCVYCIIMSIIYVSMYVCVSVFILIVICTNTNIVDRVLSFFNILLWSGVPVILISYLKLLCVIFIIIVYKIIGFVASFIAFILSFVIASYLILDNLISSIFSYIYKLQILFWCLFMCYL